MYIFKIVDSFPSKAELKTTCECQLCYIFPNDLCSVVELISRFASQTFTTGEFDLYWIPDICGPIADSSQFGNNLYILFRMKFTENSFE